MSDHTPTPWSYRAASDVGDGIIIGGQNSNAALVPGYNDHPHNLANAAFIVKAVNNHDALVAQVKYLEATEANKILQLKMALRTIAGMDPKGIRADDLGRAARIAREAITALAGRPQQP